MTSKHFAYFWCIYFLFHQSLWTIRTKLFLLQINELSSKKMAASVLFLGRVGRFLPLPFYIIYKYYRRNLRICLFWSVICLSWPRTDLASVFSYLASVSPSLWLIWHLSLLIEHLPLLTSDWSGIWIFWSGIFLSFLLASVSSDLSSVFSDLASAFPYLWMMCPGSWTRTGADSCERSTV